MAAVNALALFFVLTSVCIVLSLFTVISDHFKTAYADVPQLVMMVIMTAAVVLMIAFLRVEKQVEDISRKSYHYIHTYWSLVGTGTLYGYSIILDINHFIAGFGCLPNWISCNNAYVVRYHIVDLLFHAMRPVFMGLEVTICIVMVYLSMAQKTLITYGVAVIQAANIAICFQTIVSETFAHNHDISLEINFLSTSCWNQEYNNSWSDCPISNNDTTDSNNATDCCWPEDHELLRWLEASNPPLYLIITEFSLLVGEIMLGKLYGGRHTNTEDDCRPADDDAAENVNQSPVYVCCCIPYPVQLIARIKRLLSKIPVIVVIIAIPVANDVLFVLSIYFGMKLSKPTSDEESAKLSPTRLWWSSGGLLFTICVIIVSWILLIRPYSRPRRHVHINSFHYLPLISSAGSFLLSIKRLVQSSVNNAGAVYIIHPLLNVLHVFSQVAFLYKVKDVQIESVISTPLSCLRVYALHYVMPFLASLNYFMWYGYSVTPPQKYADIDQSVGWQTFDNIVYPLDAFFRFSSALLFWSTFKYLQPHKRISVSRQDRANANVSSEELTTRCETHQDTERTDASDQPELRESTRRLLTS